MGTQEIVGLIWICDTFKREVISQKNSCRFFCKKGKKQFPKNRIWMWLWTLKLMPGPQTNLQQQKEGGALVAFQGHSVSLGQTLLTTQMSNGRPAHSCHPPSHPEQDAWRKALSDLDSVSLLSPPYLPTPLGQRLSRQSIWLTYNMTWFQPESYRKDLNITLKHSGSLCLMWKQSTSQDLYDTPRQEPTTHPEKVRTAHHPNILHCPRSVLSGYLGLHCSLLLTSPHPCDTPSLSSSLPDFTSSIK